MGPMLFNFVGILLVTVAIIVILLVFISRVKRIHDYVEKNRSGIEVVYMITAIFTIASVFAGVIAFEMEQENKRVAELEAHKTKIESLLVEINYNIRLIDKIVSNESLTEGRYFSAAMPVTENMQDNLNTNFRDEEIKKSLINNYNGLLQINGMIKIVNSPEFVLTSPETVTKRRALMSSEIVKNLNSSRKGLAQLKRLLEDYNRRLDT